MPDFHSAYSPPPNLFPVRNEDKRERRRDRQTMGEGMLLESEATGSESPQKRARTGSLSDHDHDHEQGRFTAQKRRSVRWGGVSVCYLVVWDSG